MPGTVTQYVDKVPTFTIRDEVLHVTDGDSLSVHMPLRVAKGCVEKARKAIEEYEARRAEVVRLKGRKRGHAASS